MKKVIISILILLAGFSAIDAMESKDTFILKAPKEISLQIFEEEKETSSDEILSKSLSQNLNPHWHHQLADVKNSGYQIELEDGTVWELGWWWHFRVAGWNQGDTLVFSWEAPNSSNYMRIKNLTQNSNAWGALFFIPPPNNQTVWIQSINDHFTKVELSSGCRLSSEHFNIFRSWKEEDIVFTLLFPSKFDSDYAIWNFSAQEVVFNLNVEE